MAKSNTKKTKRSNTARNIIIVLACMLLIAAAAVIWWAYKGGKERYKDKFLPRTYINNVDVGGLTLPQAQERFAHNELPQSLVIHLRSGSQVAVSLSDFDYGYDSAAQVEKIFNGIDREKWYMGQVREDRYTFEDIPTYDEQKLRSLLSSADWGSEKNEDAQIVRTDEGYSVQAEVQGDDMDYPKLEEYILSRVAEGVFDMDAADCGCYISPKVKAADLKEECDRLNSVFNMKIVYDFDYTTETLTGDKLMDMVTIGEDGSLTADRDKAMEYVEYLADKYDTYNTERKFHATIQGDIVVPTSSDAKYGWWIYQDATCDQLVEMLEAGESVESVDPVYYETGGYVFTGREDARSADDDIGDTYIEIDLTNQHFWYYEKGKLLKDCDIVSGQTTSAARTTLPGVYKVWLKRTNYRMKDTNSDGDTWDTTCDYWTRVAIVGIGLHDSQWRWQFGGNIYKWNGSHGCINMPLEYAKYVHDHVAMDTPVVMYY